jgi:hypothetical protein
MKTKNTYSSVALFSRAFTAAVLFTCAALFIPGSPALAGQGNQGNPGVIPPQAVAYGHTYGEWSAQWWQWAFGLAPDVNPVLDPTGDLVGSGQSGPVWFLAGTFGGPAERDATIPAGKALFFPIVNWSVWEPDDDETSRLIVEHLGLDPNVLTEAEILRITANWLADRSAPVSCMVDGVAINNLANYRAESPDFEFNFNDELALLFGLDGGLKSPAVADGYWLMLAPLPLGRHTIEFHGVADISTANGDPFDLSFTVDIIYHLNVVPAK